MPEVLAAPGIAVFMLKGQVDAPANGPGPVPGIPGHGKKLTGLEAFSAILKINQKLALDHQKSLIAVGVDMPVEITVEDADPDHVIVHLGQHKVFPIILNVLRFGQDIDRLEMVLFGHGNFSLVFTPRFLPRILLRNSQKFSAG